MISKLALYVMGAIMFLLVILPQGVERRPIWFAAAGLSALYLTLLIHNLVFLFRIVGRRRLVLIKGVFMLLLSLAYVSTSLVMAFGDPSRRATEVACGLLFGLLLIQGVLVPLLDQKSNTLAQTGQGDQTSSLSGTLTHTSKHNLLRTNLFRRLWQRS